MSVIHITNFRVLDAVGQPASGWTLVTGDAESTDTGDWTIYQNNSGINWSVLDNNGPNYPFGNACYDTNDPSNYGFMGYTGNGTGLSAGNPIPSGKSVLNQANFPATGTNSGSFCEASVQLNKTGTLMLSSQEPTSSSWPLRASRSPTRAAGSARPSS